MEKENPCEGCIHYYGNYKVNRCCNYIFDVGHMRPCPPGIECSAKKHKKKHKKKDKK